jgi:hypothetical protein
LREREELELSLDPSRRHVSVVAARVDEARERRRELGVNEKAQSCAPQDRVIVLLGRKLQDRDDVLDWR